MSEEEEPEQLAEYVATCERCGGPSLSCCSTCVATITGQDADDIRPTPPVTSETFEAMEAAVDALVRSKLDSATTLLLDMAIDRLRAAIAAERARTVEQDAELTELRKGRDDAEYWKTKANNLKHDRDRFRASVAH